jgi:DNA-binding NarL/FixJ family response regulator
VIRTLIADDQALVSAGFRSILEAQGDIEVVAEAANGAEALELARRLAPDVALMDVRMPGMDGIEATRRIVLAGLPTRVLILTTFDLDEYVYAAMQAGASGFLLKDVPRDQLVVGVRTVAAGDALLAPAVTRRMIERFVRRPSPGPQLTERLSRLSTRELEVLRLIARGLANAEIASELVVSPTTVKTHVASILGKLGLRDRVQAVVLAYESGLVEPGAGIPV